MDRYCEYCVNLRSVVYCKADAAYLCLSCDTKVHSANPLSKRHHRTLICDTCRRRPSYVRCYDHQTFMCRSCDLNQHNAPSQHRRRVINSYMGSPSAQELGVLWGFDLNKLLDNSIVLSSKFGSSSSALTNKSVIGLETNVHNKETYRGIKACSVLQQLVDLLRFQTSELDSISFVIRCQEHQVKNTPDQFSQQMLLDGKCLDQQDMSLNSCSSPFAHLDHLESETDETGLPGDSFWQCKSPVLSDQLWSQNLQDLGVCEEPFCFDDVNMPDIDLTFTNFEELFRIEQEPTRIDQDTSMATTSLTNTESCTKKARHASQVMSFSHSRVSAESNGTVSIGSSTSPSSGSMEHQEPLKLKEKKNVQTKDPKQDQSGFRKARSDPRTRIKSQNWRFESHEPVTRSF